MSEQVSTPAASSSSAPSQSSNSSSDSSAQGNYGSGGGDAQSNAAFSAWDDSVSQPVEQLETTQQGEPKKEGQQQKPEGTEEKPGEVVPEGFDSLFFDKEKGMDYDKINEKFKPLKDFDYKYMPKEDEYKIPSALDKQIADPEKQVEEFYAEMGKFEAEYNQTHLNPLNEIVQLANAGRGEEALEKLIGMQQAKQTEFKAALRQKEIDLKKKQAGSGNVYQRIESDIVKADSNFNAVARELGYNSQELEQLLYGHKGSDDKFKESPYGAPLIHTSISVMKDIFKNYPNFGNMNPVDQYRLFCTQVNSDPNRLKTLVSYAGHKFNALKFGDRISKERAKWEKEYKERSASSVASPGLTGSPNTQGGESEFSWD
jgi:hypothetical protein